MVDNFKADDTSIDELLFGNNPVLSIPRYQRPYSWDKDEVEDYWNDLVSMETIPFIGSVVLNNEHLKSDGYLEVIDGQQRLLTTTIFMSALRDFCKKNGLENVAERIQRLAISREDKTGKEEFRIRCGATLEEYFESRVQSFDEVQYSGKLTKEHKRVKKNKAFFEEKITEYVNTVDTKSEKQARVQELWTTVGELTVIEIIISNDDDAYTVFETVNARGKDLSVADLLKNWIFKQVGDDDKKIESAKKKWSEIETNINQVDAEVSSFLRQFWISKYSFTSEKALYRKIKKEITDYESFLEEIRTASYWYNKLLSYNLSDWLEEEEGKKIFSSLQGLKIMRAKQVNVLFLGLLRNKDRIPNSIGKYFKLAEDFTFIYSAVSKLQANKVEKLYSAFSIDLEEFLNSSKKDKYFERNLNRLFSNFENDLKSLIPNEEFFVEKFMNIQYKNSSVARGLIRYVLERVELSFSNNEEFKVNFDTVNIEHILPQKPKDLSSWNVTKAEHKNVVNQLGNLVILAIALNSDASNSDLKNKLPILEETEIKSTKSLVSNIKETETWTSIEILDFR